MLKEIKGQPPAAEAPRSWCPLGFYASALAMRKRILLGVIAAAVLAAGLFAYLMVNTDTLIARYQPELERAASRALGRPVSFGGLEVEALPSPRIEISTLRLGGRRGFPSRSFWCTWISGRCCSED